MRDSFIFYGSYVKALEELPPEGFKKIILAVADYALNDIQPDLDGVNKMAFNFMQPVIDSNNKKWDETRKKRAESGRNGGLAKQANARNAKQNKQSPANQAVNVNGNVDVDANVDVNISIKNKVNETTSSYSLLDREPKNDIERVNKQWLLNYKELFGSLPVNPAWKQTTPLIKTAISQIGIGKVINALNTAKQDKFCLEAGYVLKTIMAGNVISRLVNSKSVISEIKKHKISRDNILSEKVASYFKEAV